jgi:hypothetical protein
MRLGALVAALAILAAVAIVDHRQTRAISARASSDSWWCAHKAVRCMGFDAAAFHGRWERRELAYELGGAALASAVVLIGARRLRLRL